MGKGSGILRVLLDVFLLACIVAIGTYLIVDHVLVADSPSADESDIRDSVTVCSKGKEKIPMPDSFPMTPLDEYVWREDGAYGYTIVNNTFDPIRNIQTRVSRVNTKISQNLDRNYGNKISTKTIIQLRWERSD